MWQPANNLPVGKYLNVAVVIPVAASAAAAAVVIVNVIVIAGVAAVEMDIFNEFNKRAAPATIRVILVMPEPSSSPLLLTSEQ